MTQDKSTSWRVYENSSAIVASGDVTICVCMHSANAALIVQAVNAHDAMKECVEALKAAQSFVEEYRETRDPGGVLIVASKINAVLAKLEKANG